jgi:hypothetical protein
MMNGLKMNANTAITSKNNLMIVPFWVLGRQALTVFEFNNAIAFLSLHSVIKLLPRMMFILGLGIRLNLHYLTDGYK